MLVSCSMENDDVPAPVLSQDYPQVILFDDEGGGELEESDEFSVAIILADRYDPSGEALGGTAECCSVLEMSNAYATFANGGVHHEPTAIRRLMRTGQGDAFLCDTIEVTERGCEFLTKSHRELILR